MIVSFSNGQSLGKAFEEFNEDGLTYFPALSLSMEERVSVNFGKRPFKFPVFGAKPIQTKPIYLIQYFEQLNKNINYLIDNQMYLNTKKNVSFYFYTLGIQINRSIFQFF